ncbi:hypothetical protein VTK26DRAFT_2545 [Humicola hyalothermophila]
MAVGCGEPLQKIILLNVREDLAAIGHLFRRTTTAGKENDVTQKQPQAEPDIADERVSAYFPPSVASGRDAIAAHSQISSRQLYDDDLLVYLEIHPGSSDLFPTMFMVTEAGMIAGGSGMNSCGLAVATNPLLSSADFVPRPGSGGDVFYMPVTCLQRCLLECADVDEALETLHSRPRHASIKVLIADADRSVSLELGPRREHVFRYRGPSPTPAGAVVHVDHFQSFEAFAARREIVDRRSSNRSSSGRGRVARLRRLTDLTTMYEQHEIEPHDVLDILSDHDGHPAERVCRHGKGPEGEGEGEERGGKMTVLVAMYSLSRRVVSVCKGPACRGHVMHFTFVED